MHISKMLGATMVGGAPSATVAGPLDPALTSTRCDPSPYRTRFTGGLLELARRGQAAKSAPRGLPHANR